MINSTLCPLCPRGIGHAMDDEHAARVKELLAGAIVLVALLANGCIPPGTHPTVPCDADNCGKNPNGGK